MCASNRMLLLSLGMLLSMAIGRAEELAVPVTISEPAGAARQAWPAGGGIPFLPGQVKDVSELGLVDPAGKPVPAQFSKLAAYDDGSVQWALVDLVVPELAAGGKAQFTVKAAKAAAPETPLKIDETDDRVTVDTGAVRFAVSKTKFALFDEVVVGGRKVVAGSTVELLNCELGERLMKVDYNRDSKVVAMKEGGRVFPCSTGKPTRVSWEYRGPVRATLRVDGEYLGVPEDAVAARLSYTTRITAWAGCPAVRVAHSIRNSHPAAGSDAYIKRAALTLRLAADAKPQEHPAPGMIFMAEPPKPKPEEPAPAADGAAPAEPPKKKKKPAGDYSAQPCDDWTSGGDGQVGLVVLHRHTGGVYRGPGTYLKKVVDGGWYKSWPGLFVQSVAGREAVVELVSAAPASSSPAGELGFTQDGTFALADRAHKDSEVWFDFYAGERDAAANKARADGCRSKLLVVAPGEWYSRTEALGSGHFGTLADEIATYRRWGWKGADDAVRHPKRPHMPYAFVPKEAIHDVSEDDAVEGYLLQFLRTGQRGYFDWAEAYDGFFRCQAVFRRDWGEPWGVPAARDRKNSGMGFGWYGPNFHDWSDSRMHGCHQYGRGLFDYYCLTGDTDSLDAGLNLAEEMMEGYDRSKPGGGITLGRSFGRAWNTALRAYQATRDPRFKKAADHHAELVLKASNWNEAQGIYLQSVSHMGYPYFEWDWVKQRPNNTVYVVPPRLLKYIDDNGLSVTMEKTGAFAHKGDDKWEIYVLSQIFELSECHQAMERHARIMNSQPMKDRLVKFTRGIVAAYWSEKCRFMRDSGYVNWPDKDKTRDRWEFTESHDACPKDPGGTHSGYSTRYVADMCARAYGFSGDRFFLDWARKCWDRGNKRMYQAPAQVAGPDEVGPFADINGAHGDTILECAARLTYEWARLPEKDAK